MTSVRFANPIFAALDTADLNRALMTARSLRGRVGGLKVGLEFLTALGPDGLKEIVSLGLPVFADTKFHDIPNTVAGAAREIAKLGIALFNVHASGGEAMMRAAKDAAADVNPGVKVIAVTVLTSIAAREADGPGRRGVQSPRDRGRAPRLRGGVPHRHPGSAAVGRRALRPAPGDDPGRRDSRGRRHSRDRPPDHGRSGPGESRRSHRGRGRAGGCRLIFSCHGYPGKNLRDRES